MPSLALESNSRMKKKQWKKNTNTVFIRMICNICIRRLIRAVIDDNSGANPIFHESKRKWIIFNSFVWANFSVLVFINMKRVLTNIDFMTLSRPSWWAHYHMSWFYFRIMEPATTFINNFVRWFEQKITHTHNKYCWCHKQLKCSYQLVVSCENVSLTEINIFWRFLRIIAMFHKINK